MRVMIHAVSARRGGGQTYLINLLSRLDAFPALEVFLLAPDSLVLPPHPRLQRLFAPAATETPLLRAVWERTALPRRLRRVRPDVLFCPGGLINVDAPEGCRTVTMFRNMIPFALEQRRRYPLGLERVRNWVLERALLRSMLRADLVIFISEFGRRVIETRTGGRLGRTVTIPHGLSDAFRAPANGPGPRSEQVPEGPYLLYVSPFHVYKNQLEVVRAYARLRERRSTPERLVLVGGRESSSYGQRVRSEIDRLALGDLVMVTGNLPYQALPPLYQHARVNIFASESENCPNVLLEELASARPVLASSRPPMPEFGGDAALYFDPASPEDLCDRLVGLLDDEEAMNEYAARARQRALEFDWGRSAERTWRAIQELASSEIATA